jgi:serine/threonine protein kinase
MKLKVLKVIDLKPGMRTALKQ